MPGQRPIKPQALEEDQSKAAFPLTREAGGGAVGKDGNFYTITSGAGDMVTLIDVGKRVDLTIQAGPDRQGGELRGSLGQFDSDADPTNDLVLQADSTSSTSGGFEPAMTGEFTEFVKTFLESWKLLLSGSMFA